jgi:hypothetical protein
MPYERIDPVDPSQRGTVVPVRAVLLTPLEREEERRRREQAREERRRRQLAEDQPATDQSAEDQSAKGEMPANRTLGSRLDLRG